MARVVVMVVPEGECPQLADAVFSSANVVKE
jgi:hypothetical protein